MELSVFTDKKVIPSEAALMEALVATYPLWTAISDYVHQQYPGAMDQWSHSGEKYGWNFRIKDKKRAILYLLPRDGYFKTAFVFGEKATHAVMQSQVSEPIKAELSAARLYAEGRGIRIDITKEDIIGDIKTLIDLST